MKVLKMALCTDKHNIPQAIDGYIFRKIENITDVYHLKSLAFQSIWSQCRLKEWLKYASVDCRSQCLQRRKNWRYTVPL